MSISPEEKFQKNAVYLCDYIRPILESIRKTNPDLIDPMMISLIGPVSIYLSSLDPNILVEGFINNSFFTVKDENNDGKPLRINLWNKIKNRDQSFFYKYADNIFAKLPKNEVTAFRALFTPDSNGKILVSQKTQNELWVAFDSFVKISISYIHSRRLRDGKYLSSIPEVASEKMPELVNIWKVNLFS